MRLAGLVLIAACAAPRGGRVAEDPAWVADTSSFTSPRLPAASRVADPIAATYGEIATKILAKARADRGAYALLAHLTDRIGHRLSGSASLERAIDWAEATMKHHGFTTRLEPVMVPHWVRGAEDGAIVTPVARPLRLIGLGGTVPTPKGGITAPVVVVRSWDELEARAAQVKGAIVLFDVALPAWTPETSGYGEVARYRSRGPSRAAKLGAVAVLMRSVTARSLRSPHTGSLTYDPAQPRIPAAAITVEDAQLISRLANDGAVTVKLRLESQTLPDARSANVIAEYRGRELPDEIVLLGAHIDSWDVGQGAHDDGTGCVTMMHALATLRSLGLAPRRTIRVVLFTNEENGLRGAKQYALDHAAELPRTVFAIEADVGGFSPRGFSIEVGDPARAARVRSQIADIATLLAPLGVAPANVKLGHSGADLTPLVAAGVTAAGFVTAYETYFDVHHTEADTLDKVDPQQLADGVAAMAVLAYVVADLPGRLGD